MIKRLIEFSDLKQAVISVSKARNKVYNIKRKTIKEEDELLTSFFEDEKTKT
jgi:hypothetical protein